jgi:hypothetical protein
VLSLVVLSLVAGRWSLVAGRWSLVAGRWSLVAGRWSLVAGRCFEGRDMQQVVVLLLMCQLGALVWQTVLCLLLFEELESSCPEWSSRKAFFFCVYWIGCDLGSDSGSRDALPQRLAGVRGVSESEVSDGEKSEVQRE